MKGKNWERKNKEIRGTFNWFDANWMKSNFDSAPRIYVARAFRLERSWKYYLSTLALWEKEDYVKSTLFLKWLRFKSSNVLNVDSNEIWIKQKWKFLVKIYTIFVKKNSYFWRSKEADFVATFLGRVNNLQQATTEQIGCRLQIHWWKSRDFLHFVIRWNELAKE